MPSSRRSSVPFDHPLWVLFSSGTTGRPKGIVHGHGGAMLEQAKVAALHFDLGPGERLFWYTTPSWMMWNFLVGALLTGASVVDVRRQPGVSGHRPALGPDRAPWRHRGRHEPGLRRRLSEGRRRPGAARPGSAPPGRASPGSTLPRHQPPGIRRRAAGPGLQIASISGGTDVVSAFVGPAPTMPVWAGELSRPCLGVALDAYDAAGRPVRGEVGELVVTRPMPSMPVPFWADPDGARYRDAYFAMFDGVWRHGDWITITDHGSVASTVAPTRPSTGTGSGWAAATSTSRWRPCPRCARRW